MGAAGAVTPNQEDLSVVTIVTVSSITKIVTQPKPQVIVPTSNLSSLKITTLIEQTRCLRVPKGGVLCTLQTIQTPIELVDLIRTADTMR